MLNMGQAPHPDLAVVFGRRCSRIAFGAGLIVCVCVLVYRMLPVDFGMGLRIFDMPENDVEPHAAALLGIGWGSAFVLGVVARLVAPRFATPRRTARVAAAGLAVPGIGIALTLPLTIHLWFAAMMGSLSGFDAWARLSLYIVGPAHLAFAVLTAVRGWRLAANKAAPSPLAVWGGTIAVSCVPFVVYLLPPLLVLLTGGLCLPVLYRMEVIAARERDLLVGTPTELPTAVASFGTR